MKKCIISLMAILLICLLGLPSIVLATDIASATILKVGTRYGDPIVIVEGAPLPAARLFFLSSDGKNQQLATLLTAFSMGKTVWMRTAGPSDGSLLQYVYINQ